jgi:hypothetical protein
MACSKLWNRCGSSRNLDTGKYQASHKVHCRNRIEAPDDVLIALNDTIERRTKLHRSFQERGDPEQPKVCEESVACSFHFNINVVASLYFAFSDVHSMVKI